MKQKFNKDIAKAMGSMQSHTSSNPNSIAQAATVAALNGPMDELKTMIKAFDERRKYMAERINSIDGVSCLVPQGAFYVMMNISQLLGKEQNQVVINGTNRLILDTLLVLIPDTGSVRNIPTFHIHTLSTSITTMKTNT